MATSALPELPLHDSLMNIPTDVSADAEKCTVEHEPSSSQDSSETGPESSSFRSTFSEQIHGKPKPTCDAVIVHQKEEWKVASDIKKQMEKKMTNGRFCQNIVLKLYGQVKSTPLYGCIEDVYKDCDRIILLWTPLFQKDKQCLKISQTIKSSAISDIIVIVHGFNGKEKPDYSHIALSDTLPVYYHETGDFLEEMEQRLLTPNSYDLQHESKGARKQQKAFVKKPAEMNSGPHPTDRLVQSEPPHPTDRLVQSEPPSKHVTDTEQTCDDNLLTTDVQIDDSQSLPTPVSTRSQYMPGSQKRLETRQNVSDAVLLNSNLPPKLATVSEPSNTNMHEIKGRKYSNDCEKIENNEANSTGNPAAAEATILNQTYTVDQTERKIDEETKTSSFFQARETEKSNDGPKTDVEKAKDYGQDNEYRQIEQMRSQGTAGPIQSEILQSGQMGTQGIVSQAIHSYRDASGVKIHLGKYAQDVKTQEIQSEKDAHAIETQERSHETPSERDVPGVETLETPSERDAPDVETQETPSERDAPSVETHETPSERRTLGVETHETPSERDAPGVETHETPSERDAPDVETHETPSERDALDVETQETPLERDAPSVETQETPSERDAPDVETQETPSERDATDVGTQETPSERDAPGVETQETPSERRTPGVETHETPSERNAPDVETQETPSKRDAPDVETQETPSKKDAPGVKTHETHSERDVPGVETHETPSERETPAAGIEEMRAEGATAGIGIQKMDPQIASVLAKEDFKTGSGAKAHSQSSGLDTTADKIELEPSKKSHASQTKHPSHKPVLAHASADIALFIRKEQKTQLSLLRMGVTESVSKDTEEACEESENEETDLKTLVGLLSEEKTTNNEMECCIREQTRSKQTIGADTANGSDLGPQHPTVYTREADQSTLSQIPSSTGFQVQTNSMTTPSSPTSLVPAFPNTVIINVGKSEYLHIQHAPVARGPDELPGRPVVQPASDPSATDASSQTLGITTARHGTTEDLKDDDLRPDFEEIQPRRLSKRSKVLQFFCCGHQKQKNPKKRSSRRGVTV